MKPMLFPAIQHHRFPFLSFLEVDKFKKEALQSFEETIYYGEKITLEEECQKAASIIEHPTPMLFESIDTEAKDPHVSKLRLLPLFAWIAIHQRTDLIETDSFKRIFKTFTTAAYNSLKIAVAFDSEEYVINALKLLDIDSDECKPAILEALNIATATNNVKILKILKEYLTEIGLSMKDLNNINVISLLFNPVRCQSNAAVEFLLAEGIDPDGSKTEQRMGNNPLSLAARVGNKQTLRLLKQYGADLNIKDFSGDNVLHQAVRNNSWDVAYFLIDEWGFDLTAHNDRFESALSMIYNEGVRNRLQSLATMKPQKHAPAELNHSQSTSSVSTTKMPEISMDSLKDIKKLKQELDQIYQALKATRSLPLSEQPHEGDKHKQHHALARTLIELIKDSTYEDAFKLDLINVAVEHKLFDNQSLPIAKTLLTSAVRMTIWRTDHPTPVMPSQSQTILLAYRDTLVLGVNQNANTARRYDN